MRKAVFAQIRVDFGARHAQHRADDAIPPRRDAAQSAQRCAAHQIQKHGFQIVVGGVRRGDGRAEPFKKCIAQAPCRLFHAPAALRGIRAHIAAGDGKRNVQLAAQSADKRLVTVGLRAAQMVVIVRGGKGERQLLPERVQHMQHRNRVRAARNGAHDVRAGFQKRLLAAPAQKLIPHASIPDRRTW